MRQVKTVTHKQYNGTNTPAEHLDDSLGRMIADEMVFPYAVKQFDPRNTNDMGKKFNPRRAYANRGVA